MEELRIAKIICASQYHEVNPTELSILLIDESQDRGRMIELGLRESGFQNVSRIVHLKGVASEIVQRDPDIIVMDLGNPQRDLLEHMFRLTRAIRKPIAMFVDQSSDEALLEAMEAGVSAYVVDGLRKERVKPILDLAIARFKAFENLRQQRDHAIEQLEGRKLVEKAKALLIKAHGIAEDDAYVRLRSTAMQRNIAIADVAREIIGQLQPQDDKERKRL